MSYYADDFDPCPKATSDDDGDQGAFVLTLRTELRLRFLP